MALVRDSENSIPQKLHIIYIITKLELGGAQKVCLSLFENFAKTNSAVLICGRGGKLDSEAVSYGKVYFIDALKNCITPRHFVSDIKALLKIYALIKAELKKHKHLVVHTHSSKAGLLGRWAAWFAGCKNIVHTVHGFGFNSRQNFLLFWIIWLAEFFTACISTRLIFVAACDQRYAQQNMLVPGVKCSLIRASAAHVPIGQLAPKRQRQKVPIKIGTVSCFKPQKNLFDLLKAFKCLKIRLENRSFEQQVCLEVVGDGELRAEIESFVAQNNLASDVILKGWVKNLKPFFRSIDIFAMSSLWEGLPCAVVEAQFFKLPVVAYNVGGIAETVAAGKNGFLIVPKDVITLCDRLEILVVNHDLRFLMSSFVTPLMPFRFEHALALHAQLYRIIIL
jgi:glycosyltransferase involved in cell wall biosynthesis